MTDNANYSPPGKFSTVDLTSKRDVDLKLDMGKQENRNEVVSMRSKYERIAVRYADDTYTEGAPLVIPQEVWTKYIVNGSLAADQQEVLLDDQVTPWDIATSDLTNLEPNGFYVFTIRIRSDFSDDSEVLFRLIEKGTSNVIVGSQALEGLDSQYWDYALVFYVTAPADSVGKTYELELFFNPIFPGATMDLATKYITIHRMM